MQRGALTPAEVGTTTEFNTLAPSYAAVVGTISALFTRWHIRAWECAI